MVKYLRISSYIRKPFLIYDLATAPFWISYTVYEDNLIFFFISVLYSVQCKLFQNTCQRNLNNFLLKAQVPQFPFLNNTYLLYYVKNETLGDLIEDVNLVNKLKTFEQCTTVIMHLLASSLKIIIIRDKKSSNNKKNLQCRKYLILHVYEIPVSRFFPKFGFIEYSLKI